MVVLVAACGGVAPSAVTRSVAGTFVLDNGAPVERSAVDCSGTGGYSDIRVGASVVARDADGTIIGTSALRLGTDKPLGNFHCNYTFAVGDLPESPFYSFEVSHRGALAYSLAEMEARDWTVDLTLGD